MGLYGCSRSFGNLHRRVAFNLPIAFRSLVNVIESVEFWRIIGRYYGRVLEWSEDGRHPHDDGIDGITDVDVVVEVVVMAVAVLVIRGLYTRRVSHGAALGPEICGCIQENTAPLNA